jgi:cytidine deaminase
MPPSPITLSPGQQAELLSAARDAAQHAYAPYSGFRVGAALLLEGGEIVTAANVEIAVTNLNNAPSSPCGACRQVLSEFMPANGLILFPFDGSPHTHTLAELFPFSFDLTHAG